ncbi:uncharacterized protein LTR77_009101 [Saxophila tyrrhenica]|uniref:Uncharacterized protein n=1 Tax=Saxophila tyrrhenica TaxID=1690608 RepID=A0AAV9P3P9_9PEZI|nr:hypothetical protein LTR77_009101 [Saxophila tyrrhenica]
MLCFTRHANSARLLPPEEAQQAHTIRTGQDKPYPYRWFTPVALIGATILLVLLSVMNFVQNSYRLEVTYADNPNSTTTNGIWYSHWPSYLTNSVRPTCQPANLPVGTQFFTDQTGFTWTLTSVWQPGKRTSASPSLPYLNNPLEQCNIRDIQVSFGSSQLVQTAQSLGTIVTSTDIQVRAFVTCGIWSPTGYMKFNATAMYDTISPNAVAGTTAFVAQNPAAKASVYWAEVLLSAYWLQTDGIAGGGYFSTYSPYAGKGLVVLYPNPQQPNITDLNFFNMTYTFLSAKTDHPVDLTLSSGPLAPLSHYANRGRLSDLLWRPLDGLTKAMYSAVLTDLGQTDAPAESNIVASEQALQQFSTNLSAIDFLSDFYHLPLIEDSDFNTTQHSDDATGKLGLTRSVISTKYLCQVPRRRPWGDVFIAVLLADLVLLQAAWKLYTFAVDQAMTRVRVGSKWCEGCVGKEEGGEDGVAEAVERAWGRWYGHAKGASADVSGMRTSGTSFS